MGTKKPIRIYFFISICLVDLNIVGLTPRKILLTPQDNSLKKSGSFRADVIEKIDFGNCQLPKNNSLPNWIATIMIDLLYCQEEVVAPLWDSENYNPDKTIVEKAQWFRNESRHDFYPGMKNKISQVCRELSLGKRLEHSLVVGVRVRKDPEERLDVVEVLQRLELANVILCWGQETLEQGTLTF